MAAVSKKLKCRFKKGDYFTFHFHFNHIYITGKILGTRRERCGTSIMWKVKYGSRHGRGVFYSTEEPSDFGLGVTARETIYYGAKIMEEHEYRCAMRWLKLFGTKFYK